MSFHEILNNLKYLFIKITDPEKGMCNFFYNNYQIIVLQEL